MPHGFEDDDYLISGYGRRDGVERPQVIFNASTNTGPHEVSPEDGDGAVVRFPTPEAALAYAEATPGRWMILPVSA